MHSQDLVDQFGHASPLQALIDQKFLKIVADTQANGQVEEFFQLGDAARGDAEDMCLSDVDQELEDLIKDE